MPRLSILVPHLHDDSGLEATLLSILENREIDSEVIITHDGSYGDPFGLGQDEVVLIETDTGASFAAQLNLAAAAACSPVIQVLLPGSQVVGEWYVEGLEILRNKRVAAVCQSVGDSASDSVYIGLSSESLPHRRVTSSHRNAAGPLLCGGFFRKKTLKQTGGWFDSHLREVSEIEFALLVSELDLKIEVAHEVTVFAPKKIAAGCEAGYEIGRTCGQLACAYSEIEGSVLEVDSVAKRLGHLASGLMSPKTVAERLGWVMGIRDRSLVKAIQSRVQTALENLETERSTIAIPLAAHSDRRRAA